MGSESSASMDTSLALAAIALIIWYCHWRDAYINLSTSQLNICLAGWHLHLDWTNGLTLVCKSTMKIQVTAPQRGFPKKKVRRNHVRPGRQNSNTKVNKKKTFISDDISTRFQGYGLAGQINK